MHDASATCRLAHHCHAIWVSTELGDVLLNPFERKPLVEKPGIGGPMLVRKGFPGQETLQWLVRRDRGQGKGERTKRPRR